ncbi:MAG: hypothetical protein AAB769_01220 [Patescibacteria group bacterium]
MTQQINIAQKEKELVLARLEVLSPELHFSVGADSESFSRDEMIKQINDNTEVGKDFIKVELEFLRAFRDGSLMNNLVTG